MHVAGADDPHPHVGPYANERVNADVRQKKLFTCTWRAILDGRARVNERSGFATCAIATQHTQIWGDFSPSPH